MSYRRNHDLAALTKRLREHAHSEDDFWRERCPDCADLARALFDDPVVSAELKRGREQIARGKYVRMSDLRKELGLA